MFQCGILVEVCILTVIASHRECRALQSHLATSTSRRGEMISCM